jgi:hypothetical protein
LVLFNHIWYRRVGYVFCFDLVHDLYGLIINDVFLRHHKGRQVSSISASAAGSVRSSYQQVALQAGVAKNLISLHMIFELKYYSQIDQLSDDV